MSSASHARVSSRSERRTTNDNGSSRAPSGQQGGSRAERQDPRRPPSPQASAAGNTHRRTTSSSQRTRGGVEERRTEKVQVTTRETVTSRTRSPERRPGPLVQLQERQKTSDVGRAHSGDPRPKSSKVEAPQGMLLCGYEYLQFLTNVSTMEPGGNSGSSHERPLSIPSLDSASCITSSAATTAQTILRTNFGSSRSGHIGGSVVRIHGL